MESMTHLHSITFSFYNKMKKELLTMKETQKAIYKVRSKQTFKFS